LLTTTLIGEDEQMSDENTYDVIVVGAGLGGLVAGSLLAQVGGRRVLVVERLFKAGGYTNSFGRGGGRKWNVGLHYVGKMGVGSLERQLIDLATGGGVTWHKLPDPLEKFSYPDFSFAVPVGRAAYEARLAAEFPAEADGIRQYFADVGRLGALFTDSVLNGAWPAVLAQDPVALETTGGYLQRVIGDERLRSLLASQWGDYGLPPAQSAFVNHALLVASYLDGAYLPVGGADTIADSIKPLIEAAGGKVLTNYTVNEILIENGAVVGIRAVSSRGKQTQEEIFHAPAVISDAGAYHTLTNLAPQAFDSAQRAAAAMWADGGYQVVVLFLGFGSDPRELGFAGENHWLFSSTDHDAMYADRSTLFEGQPQMAFVSFPSLNDPGTEVHLGQILAPLDYALFEPWQDLPWRKRGDEYMAVKERISQALMDFVDQRYPGFKEAIDFYEMGTPLTFRHFIGHRRGAIYGLPGTPARFGADWLQADTPVANLYLAGVDAAVTRAPGALLGGVAAAGLVLGEGGADQIVAAAKRWQPPEEPQ
jgi:all-trans-retinol 13,14-reductase